MTKPTITPSPEQRQLIAHRAGHLQVIACAGSGKTQAISRPVAWPIEEEGVEPAQIIAFTYTQTGAASLRNRITRQIADSQGQGFFDRLGRMLFNAIHAYCLDMPQVIYLEEGCHAASREKE